MSDIDVRPARVRFGAFEVDLRAGELFKQGLKLKLHGQPLQVLAMLLEHAGELVTREEIRGRLWPQNTYVDFEHSVNSSINRLREALGDDAATPRFIETLPRHGYRFIAPVETLSLDFSATGNGVANSVPIRTDGSGTANHADPFAATERRSSVPLFVTRRWIPAAIVGGTIALLAVLIGLNVLGLRDWTIPQTAPVPKIESIAVLPLANLSRDPEQEYFADGMTEELITNLGKIGALRVISRTSVMRHKGTKMPLPEIAKELNVDALVEGTVLRSGDRVRVTANLLRAKTDRHLWAESYEREMRDVLILQDEVARAIADEIRMKLRPKEQARFAAARAVNPAAYEAYLKGRLFYYRETPDDLRKAIHYGEQAIQIDPQYAPAHALLAACYYDTSQSRFGDLPDTEAARKAKATALKALELDGSLAAAHVVLGSIHDGVDWDWAGAEREFRRAIELDPNLVQAHVGLAYHLAFVGRSDEAIRDINRAVELDPLSSYTFLAEDSILYVTRHYDQAIEKARSWVEIHPDSAAAYDGLARALEATGVYDQEVAALQKEMTLLGESADVVAGLGRAYEPGGIGGVWRYDLERLTKKGPHGDLLGYYSAELNSLLGNKDKAIESVERMYSDPASRQMMFGIKMDPRCDNLRSDPRFQAILRHMNFPP